MQEHLVVSTQEHMMLMMKEQKKLILTLEQKSIEFETLCEKLNKTEMELTSIKSSNILKLNLAEEFPRSNAVAPDRLMHESVENICSAYSKEIDQFGSDYRTKARQIINFDAARAKVIEILMCREIFNNTKFSKHLLETVIQEYVDAIQGGIQKVKEIFQQQMLSSQYFKSFPDKLTEMKNILPSSFYKLVEILKHESEVYCSVLQKKQMVEFDKSLEDEIEQLEHKLFSMNPDWCINGFSYYGFRCSSHNTLISEYCVDITIKLNPLKITRNLHNDRSGRKRDMFLVSETGVVKADIAYRKNNPTHDIYTFGKSLDELRKMGFIVNNNILVKIK